MLSELCLQYRSSASAVVSTPTKGMPLRPEFRIMAIDQRRSFQVAALSPVQCAT